MVEMKFQGELRPAVKEGVFGYRRWKERGRGARLRSRGAGIQRWGNLSCT